MYASPPLENSSCIPPPPWVFRKFAAYWELPEDLARTWWAALALSRWSRPTSWRQMLMLYAQGTTSGTHHLIHEVSSPVEVMTVVEDLHHERRLTRAQTTRIEEHILTWVSGDCTWR